MMAQAALAVASAGAQAWEAEAVVVGESRRLRETPYSSGVRRARGAREEWGAE